MRRLKIFHPKFILAGILPLDPSANDIINKESKTFLKSLHRNPSNETGWDRLKQMFTVDEFGTISSELNSVYQAGFLGFLIGAIYGGVTQSRIGYINFMENNEATTFKSHFDAKRKLQNQFTINFAQGGFKWGWRVGLFTTSYCGIITGISVYRDKTSIYEYLAAGAITGAIYKINLGLRGVAAGGIIGGALGGIAGIASLLIMRTSGTTMEEVRYWQYKWRLDRDENVQQAFKHQFEQEYKTPELLKAHDARVGEKVTLESVK